MKSSKRFVGVVILIFIVAVLVYAVCHNNESEGGPTVNKSDDSATNTMHEMVPAEMGAKPESDLKDGSVIIVEEFIKSHAQNPNTFQFLEWSDGDYWKVRCKYRGIASFDKEVTTNAWFFIQDNKVVYTKIISKI